MEATLRYRGRTIGAADVAFIQGLIAEHPGASRRALSKKLCEAWGWVQPNGVLRDMVCRGLMLELHRQGRIELPAVRKSPPNNIVRRKAPRRVEVDASPLRGPLRELRPLEFRQVRRTPEEPLFGALIEQYHYLGYTQPVGEHLKYIIYNGSRPVACFAWSSAPRHLGPRDRYIGWSADARRRNIHGVAYNTRYLILPSVEVANLASHVLALSVRRLAGDWRERYGYEPVLVESFVDGQRFAGSCYRAANWQWVGQTAGRANPYSNGKQSTGKKEIYLYPLRADWRSELCHEPEDRLVLRTPIGETGDWVEEEFAGARLYDGRLRRRLYSLARDFFGQPGVLIPQACGGSVAKSKAAYRFFDNERVGMEPLLRGHVEATALRVSRHEVVLAAQDTTTLNYTSHPATGGLGPINTTKDQGVGLILHDTMAFSCDGTPLGLLDLQCWARDPEEAGKKEKRKQLPIEEKESFKWLRSYQAVAEVQQLCPQTMLVSVGDREADIHELFEQAQRTESGPKLLVRAERSRNRKVLGDEQALLWDKMCAETVAGQLEIHIPRNGSRAARVAKLEVRYAPVTLKPPQGKNLQAVEAWAVYAVEVEHGPEVTSPLEWMLLTTVEVSCFEQAVERLRWYSLRWGIEVYHRVLKSGCRIEDRQLNAASRIESCLAIDLVVAWRIYWLVRQGRETPQVPCDVFFEEDEWKVLYAVVRQEAPPDTAPTLREAVRMTAKLGGFLGRKGDGEPGTTTLWRGLVRLDNMVIGYKSTQFLSRQRDGP